MLQTYTPQKIKDYSHSQLNELCEQLRNFIYDTVMQCGGHLASNLGSVESIVALFRTFDFPNDKIVFDVGHQCYPYKILSGRKERFSTLRQFGGISGFPKRTESEYDAYDTGHAGTSVSAALGIAKARDLLKENYQVIAYIGDGSFNNGLIYEALNSLKILNTKILIILNDNGMSISPTVGGMHDILDGLGGENADEKIRLLEQFGLKYVGVKNGNDLEEMLDSVAQAKELLNDGSVLLHISTKKGKGYEFSEDHPTDTHGVSPANAAKAEEYSEILGKTLCEMAQNNEKIAVVSAAMKESLGLEEFFNRYPERAFDVGICEENAAVLCASMASAGVKPYYAIYSTFLQRAYDEIVHDVCMMNLPVTFCIDRAGISGADGETHQGVFDLSYLTMIPNLTIVSPKDTREFKNILKFSETFNAPLAIRYPRAGSAPISAEDKPIEYGKWEYLYQSERAQVTVLAAGERCVTMAMQILKSLQAKGKECNIVNARFIKPLDTEMLANMTTQTVVTIEDNVLLGGFGSSVALWALQNESRLQVKCFAYEDKFITHGSVTCLQKLYGLDPVMIENFIDGKTV